MTDKQLASRAMRVARRKFLFGRIDRPTFDKVMRACEDDRILSAWNQNISKAGLVPSQCYDLLSATLTEGSFLDWFMENWPKILEILLAILPLFLKDEK